MKTLSFFERLPPTARGVLLHTGQPIVLNGRRSVRVSLY
jgi:hypothetical protein